MSRKNLSLEALWQASNFEPNPEQVEAIRHVDGALFIAAGPGSGKTRVLLWRALNLIVFHDVAPERIVLSTFTEKAAFQLREGIRSLLALVTHETGRPYDISRMYVGTAHSLCRRIIHDRRFSDDGHVDDAPVLMDALGQYFQLSKSRTWSELTKTAEFAGSANQEINLLFDPGRGSKSRHRAVTSTMALFNRLSEECIQNSGTKGQKINGTLGSMLRMYDNYKGSVLAGNGIRKTDFALLQQEALTSLIKAYDSESAFSHVIIDEYQDTNTVQERLFFKLASDHKNICVVGDDDQALYRFRGATVENFVEFPDRCNEYMDLAPLKIRKITLSTNYRSLSDIVDFYRAFIRKCDWTREDDPSREYRVPNKRIEADRKSSKTAVVASTPGHPDDVCAEVAGLVRRLIDQGKVDDPNQIAFLYPSLKSTQVGRMKSALEALNLKVYAPRAGSFLEVSQAVDVFGVFLQIFGKPERGDFPGRDYRDFHDLLEKTDERGQELLRSDPKLTRFISQKRAEIESAVSDFQLLQNALSVNGWDAHTLYDPKIMNDQFLKVGGLSKRANRSLRSTAFSNFASMRLEQGDPYTLRYVVLRATSIDWTVLELFYQISAFDHFRAMYDLAESGVDEGPICNLGLISQYLARFMDEYARVLTAEVLADNLFQRLLFAKYLYALFRLGESEYEDAEDPFPKGRIPFLTIHQTKGLEFPIVVLGNPRKNIRGPQRVEELVRPMLDREGEPLDRLSEFDTMRLFYVSLSRAENLLIIPHWKSQGNYINPPFKELLDDAFPRIPDFQVEDVEKAKPPRREIARNYSFTGDYLLYTRCPRQYMIFREYGLLPATTQTYAFGRLVHQTIEDLHVFLINEREKVA